MTPRSTSAQRPKASEGESGAAGGHYRRVRVLNARRHRRGNQGLWTTGEIASSPARPVLNARRHRRGNQEDVGASSVSSTRVLNARRHRRGQRRVTPRSSMPTRAQRPKASEGESGPAIVGLGVWACSTPEGIGGGIRGVHLPSCFADAAPRAQRPKASEGESVGDDCRERASDLARCSTPEGIGGGIRFTEGGIRWHLVGQGSGCAQRPKASEGESDPPWNRRKSSRAAALEFKHPSAGGRVGQAMMRCCGALRREMAYMDLFHCQRPTSPSVTGGS